MTVSDTPAAVDVREGRAPTIEPDRRATFPRVRGRVRGYDPAAVDAFLTRARLAFERNQAHSGEPSESAEVTAATVRTVSFPLVKNGYAIEAVDAALGRVEDAFAAAERARAIEEMGAHAWVERQRADGQQILDRLGRPRRRRFDRVSFMRFGYRIDEVDIVADRVAAFLVDGGGLSVEQIRAVAFRMQRGGYREAQVDALLDAMVDIILAVR